MAKSKEDQIQELRDKISYWTEQLKVIKNQADRGIINDKILDAKREIGKLSNKALDRVKKVDIIDATPIATRLEVEAHRSRSGDIGDINIVEFKK